jgi:hypothetical protein
MFWPVGIKMIWDILSWDHLLRQMKTRLKIWTWVAHIIDCGPHTDLHEPVGPLFLVLLCRCSKEQWLLKQKLHFPSYWSEAVYIFTLICQKYRNTKKSIWSFLVKIAVVSVLSVPDMRGRASWPAWLPWEGTKRRKAVIRICMCIVCHAPIMINTCRIIEDLCDSCRGTCTYVWFMEQMGQTSCW